MGAACIIKPNNVIALDGGVVRPVFPVSSFLPAVCLPACPSLSLSLSLFPRLFHPLQMMHLAERALGSVLVPARASACQWPRAKIAETTAARPLMAFSVFLLDFW